MDFIEYGSLLQERRQALKLSLDEVSSHLKLTKSLLQSIESGEVSHSTSPVYLRGFIRSYACYLQIDDEITRVFLDEYFPLEQTGEMTIVVPPPTWHIGFRFAVLRILPSVLVCSLCICIGWYAVSSGILDRIIDRTQPQEVRLLPEEQPKPGTSGLGSAESVRLLPPETHRQQTDDARHLIPEAKATTAQNRIAIPVASMPHVVVLTAMADCWFLSQADGVRTEKMMHAGEVLELPFKNKLVLRLGNADGVRVEYDGVEQHLDTGKSGRRVRTMQFPPDVQQ
ncbi:MAG: DUF4115 domain-containing protein [Desulfovibrionaceae bacterium]|nr:DUF4115 domain-containing protein [Desulfovibrionaceae bacterium]